MGKKKLQEHIIDRDCCQRCWICIAMCPMHVLELDKHEKAVAARLEDCIA